MRADLITLGAKTDTKIAGLDAKIDTRTAELEARIAQQEAVLTWRITVSIGINLAALSLAILKFL